MKGRRNAPTMIYVACVLLAMIYWLVLFGSRMDGLARNLYVLLLPLIGTPFILWVVHKEGQEPEGYFKDTYAGRAGAMWAVRVFMMIVASVLSSVVAIMILGAFGLVFHLVK